MNINKAVRRDGKRNRKQKVRKSNSELESKKTDEFKKIRKEKANWLLTSTAE